MPKEGEVVEGLALDIRVLPDEEKQSIECDIMMLKDEFIKESVQLAGFSNEANRNVIFIRVWICGRELVALISMLVRFADPPLTQGGRENLVQGD